MLKLENITYQPQTGNDKVLDDINLRINTFDVVLININAQIRKYYLSTTNRK